MSKYDQTLLNVDFARNFISNSKLIYQSGEESKEFSIQEIIKTAESFANFLTNSKLEKQNRIVLLSESRPEWGITFLGSVYAGQTLVPIDPKLTLREITSILDNCKPSVLCFSAKYRILALELKKQLSSIGFLIEIDLVLENKNKQDLLEKQIVCLKDLAEESPTFLSKVKPEEVLLIVYTSGTTSKPKGVMLTYRNLSFELESIFSVIKLTGQRFLSVLPMNHMFELVAGFLYPIHSQSSIYYIQDLYPREIIKTIKEQKITSMIVVPVFLSLIKKAIQRELNSVKDSQRVIFDYLYKISCFLPTFLRRMVFFKIHQSIGVDFKNFISGGAALSERLESFLINLGFEIYQGYGLTETSPVVSVNTPGNYAFGSVGRPLPGVEVKIEPTLDKLEELNSEELKKEMIDTGEILVRGDNVMKGYYNQEELTKEVIDSDGWFYTGDIGRLDSKGGVLYITGRLKNLIVLPGGKKVHPEEIEEVFLESSLFKEVCILGTPSRKREAGVSTEEVSVAVVPSATIFDLSQEEIEKQISEEINFISSKFLADYKKPTRIFIFQQDLPKTPTKKFKRKEILRLIELINKDYKLD